MAHNQYDISTLPVPVQNVIKIRQRLSNKRIIGSGNLNSRNIFADFLKLHNFSLVKKKGSHKEIVCEQRCMHMQKDVVLLIALLEISLK